MGEQIRNIKDEINDLKTKQIETNKNEEISKQFVDIQNELNGLNETILRQQSIFEQSNISLVNISNVNDDDNKQDEAQGINNKVKQIKEWVFNKLEFNKTDLDSIYNKLINDGFDDISLLSELNDDTLKSMGIHKRGDRIKILRACKTLGSDSII